MIGAIALTFAVGIALSPLRHIDFYADESRTDLLPKILQDKKSHVTTATYIVLDASGERLCRMRKNYLTNFILVTSGPDGQAQTRGEFNRKTTLFDRYGYGLDISRDRPPTIDRWLAVALGVLLDTGKHR